MFLFSAKKIMRKHTALRTTNTAPDGNGKYRPYARCGTVRAECSASLLAYCTTFRAVCQYLFHAFFENRFLFDRSSAVGAYCTKICCEAMKSDNPRTSQIPNTPQEEKRALLKPTNCYDIIYPNFSTMTFHTNFYSKNRQN